MQAMFLLPFAGVTVRNKTQSFRTDGYQMTIRLTSDLGTAGTYPIDSVKLTGKESVRAHKLRNKVNGYLGAYSKIYSRLKHAQEGSAEFNKLAKAWAKWEKTEKEFKLYVYQRTLVVCKRNAKALSLSAADYESWPPLIKRLEGLVSDTWRRKTILGKKPVQEYILFTQR